MHYIVATDGSTESNRAVEYATRQACAMGARLEIVHVLTPQTELVNGEVVLAGEETAVEYGQRTIDRAADRVLNLVNGDAVSPNVFDGTAEEFELETELLAGRPAVSIAEYATDVEADAIYVGHRGLSDERQQVVGSVAKSVVDKATVPVTIIR